MDKIVNELKNELKKSFKDFKGLYIYGSQVNDTYNKNSDVDIVVIFSKYNFKKLSVVWAIVSKIEYTNNIVIDLKPYTYLELKRNYIFCNEVVGKGVFYA
ncbi:nucleotidyltransferase domain-containing protein [Candidatus Endomicrobiellum cubanum]|uniref:nucleotidyltransferase domain-containing protein n=1 Tax=Candidatus Endomicrobiellum cubanum TaxID=3242325 RepID=UPI0035937472